MIKKLKQILDNDDYLKYRNNFFLNSFLLIFEFVSIVSIPIFITILIDPVIFYEKIGNYNFLDFIKNLTNFELIFASSLFIITIFLLKNLFILLFIVREQNLVKKIKINILNKLFKHYINAPYVLHLKRNPETLSRYISHEISNLDLYMSSLSNYFRETVAIAVIFFILIWVAPIITISTFFVFLIISFLYNYKIKPLIDSKSQTNQIKQKNLFQIINETFTGIRDLKTMSKENEITNLFSENQEMIAKNDFIFRIIEKLPKIFFEIIAVTFVSIISLLYINLNQSYVEILPKISLFAVCVFRFMPAFNSVIINRTYMRIAEPYLSTIGKEIDNIKKRDRVKKNQINKIYTPRKNKMILTQNVSFNYPGELKTALKNINFEIEKDSTIGITGKTGSGKSTLFYIMLGLVKPDLGTVFNYQKDIFLNLNEWKKKIGYISQNIFLMDGSIKKNITFNFIESSFDEEKFEKAISFSELKPKIDQLNKGVDTIVGTNGMRLSGGERQRIAIARAIYKDPDIFFMDEATSALDDNTENKIIENLKNNFKNKTKILIAHRKTSLDKCDEVKTLQNGIIK